MSCIKNESFNVDNLVHNITVSHWTQDYSNNEDGWHFTRSEPLTMTTNFSEVHRFLMKSSSQYCSVYLHDDQHWLMNVNPLTVPAALLELNEDFLFKTIYLKVSKIKMMNNCEAAPSHNVTSCVKNYVDKVLQ